MKIFGTLFYYLAWPILYVALNNSRRTRVVIVVDGRVLLVQPRFSKEVWDLPGGGIHSNESPSSAVIRELHEETGISLHEQDLTQHGVTTHTDRKISTELYAFAASLDAQPNVHLQKLELRAYVWQPIDDLKGQRLSKGCTAVLKLVGVLR